MKPVQFIGIIMASTLFFLCTTTKASTALSAELVKNDDLWDLFQERQNLRALMKEAHRAPFSNLLEFTPLKPAQNDIRSQILNKSLRAFPSLDFNTELLGQIKENPDFEIHDFLFAYFTNLFETTKKKDESSLLNLTLSEKKQCLLLSKKSKLTADLRPLKQMGIASFPISNYILLGRGFCFEILSKILKESQKKTWNQKQQNILETTFKTLADNEIFIRFFNKPGVIGVYTPTDDVISISTPSQFDLNTLAHETAHASFNRFFHKLFTFIQENQFKIPPEFLSEPDEELSSVANLERSPFLNLLNEFQAWMYEEQMSDKPADHTKLANIILSYYGSGMKKEVHTLFMSAWAKIKTPEEVRLRIKERIINFNRRPQKPFSNYNMSLVSAVKNIDTLPTLSTSFNLKVFIQSLGDLNSDISSNMQALEHYFEIVGIQQLPREVTKESKSLASLSELDSLLSHQLKTRQAIYHLKDLSYFLSNRVLPIELPKTMALLTQALQTEEESSSGQLVRNSFFPDPYSARTKIDWPIAVLSAVEPSKVATQYQEVIANFLRIGAGIYLTPFLENGADEFAEVSDCSSIRSQLGSISNNKLSVYQLSLNYLNYFRKYGNAKVQLATEFAFKSEPSFNCQ